MRQNDALKIKDFVQLARVERRTYSRQKRRGFFPAPDAAPRKISWDQYWRWEARLREDRRTSGKAWIRWPLVARSWMTADEIITLK